jgi:hypothetical protein
MNRNQRFKIVKSICKPMELKSGVPRERILPYIGFTIYKAALEKWVTYLTIYNYVNDTSSFCKDKEEKKVLKKLQEDAEGTVQFIIQWAGGLSTILILHDAAPWKEGIHFLIEETSGIKRSGAF